MDTICHIEGNYRHFSGLYEKLPVILQSMYTPVYYISLTFLILFVLFSIFVLLPLAYLGGYILLHLPIFGPIFGGTPLGYLLSN